jgi:membrane-associated progesterone receptor component
MTVNEQSFTAAELATYNGTEDGRPIYVAIKSQVFDVTSKKEMYGPSGSYHVFAGRDVSRVRASDYQNKY